MLEKNKKVVSSDDNKELINKKALICSIVFNIISIILTAINLFGFLFSFVNSFVMLEISVFLLSVSCIVSLLNARNKYRIITYLSLYFILFDFFFISLFI